MATEDIRSLTEALTASTAHLKQSIAGSTEDAAQSRRSDGGWSPLEIVEHVLIVDSLYRAWVEAGTPLEAPQRDASREAALCQLVIDRSKKRSAPEPSLPKGKFQNIPEAIAALDANLEVNRAFVETLTDNIRRIEIDHPRFGKFTAYESMLIIINHTRRHIGQLEEMKATTSAAV